eukprot:COSAG01_NODE_1160_length_11460_cov_196.773611_9_plen_178_part_00
MQGRSEGAERDLEVLEGREDARYPDSQVSKQTSSWGPADVIFLVMSSDCCCWEMCSGSVVIRPARAMRGGLRATMRGGLRARMAVVPTGARMTATVGPRAASRAMSQAVKPDPWVLEEFEGTDVTPPGLFAYCAPPPSSPFPPATLGAGVADPAGLARCVQMGGGVKGALNLMARGR